MESKKSNAGRPTKYQGEDTVKLAKLYAKSGYMLDNDVIPTHEGLAEYLNVCTSTLDNWSEAYPEFLGALRYLKAMQKRILLNMGLTGSFNSTIAKLVLSANHGVHEKSEKELSGSLGIKEFLNDE